ncbi:hypothetical protein JAAARDRAFT_39185 [Jaapia argillacea MUCL 33604]|uniref:Uncharacterized protein n=1 Tax=Jaapia argillacea MUCL 33604 TaxID=933084 RepID=A0A067PFG3_9AGAM|nr:hypothetical protein JAAARDRAFT_39185 [Jaapia argillacea MUCL 33604]
MIPIDPFTAVTGAVEVAWKIKKAMDQLTDNDQRLAELTSSLTTTIQELGYLIKAHQQDLASPEHLQDLAALQMFVAIF